MAALDPSSFQYQLFLILTIILIGVKCLLAIYLGKKIHEKKKETGKYTIDFVFGMFVLFIGLIISRIIFVYFDFFLTYFDSDVYYKYAIYWKVALLISAIGLAFFNFVLDKKALHFKLKGIIAYFVLGGSIVILFWPVNSPADFQTISALSLITSSGTVLVLFIFLYIGIKIPGLRKPAFMTIAGFVIYALGPILVNDAILEFLRTTFGEQMHILVFFLFITLKIVGLVIISYGITKFSIV